MDELDGAFKDEEPNDERDALEFIVSCEVALDSLVWLAVFTFVEISCTEVCIHAAFVFTEVGSHDEADKDVTVESGDHASRPYLKLGAIQTREQRRP